MNFRGGRKTGGRRARGTDVCTCPKCGKQIPHKRGIPCSTEKCPDCGTPMRGSFCL